jgi:hypothetical protein
MGGGQSAFYEPQNEREKMNHKDLKMQLKDKGSMENAKKYFGEIQPRIFQTDFYQPKNANWAYIIGIVGVNNTTDNGIQNSIHLEDVKWFKVITQFGKILSANEIYLPTI